ncbi:hypothetical protein [Sinorhizobium meliloti]|uniref:hypothetical protein n=1 Tax=Rhizobium meliloti TaxID=382 RepID=UPI00237FF22D|nr:hypothetical protein [Sinorhizobium meliloti]MDE3778755.1 hypothetical protein [Sinorhizobium meliloti]
MSELEENRLLDSEFQTISSEPLIGRLNLETDLGTIDLLVNKEAAEFLISVLLEFRMRRPRPIDFSVAAI